MTALQKKQLYSKWNSYDRDTRIRLACEYLKILRTRNQEISWLQFLNSQPKQK
ncbi:hypothetical protein [Desulforhopalus sp. IMCC35007]|uniref:hypothetical protein n=1 Tax=Desulforhopalus sp. IMCC35007 TaxID=2569543 RepID=UPI00145F98B6|nr:hypothetical protein [Desulforhopalus sp. IMCC35007]